jgi:hypothetical protein
MTNLTEHEFETYLVVFSVFMPEDFDESVVEERLCTSVAG